MASSYVSASSVVVAQVETLLFCISGVSSLPEKQCKVFFKRCISLGLQDGALTRATVRGRVAGEAGAAAGGRPRRAASTAAVVGGAAGMAAAVAEAARAAAGIVL